MWYMVVIRAFFTPFGICAKRLAIFIICYEFEKPASPRPPTTEPARIDPNPMGYRIRRANGSLQAALSKSPREKSYKNVPV
jgi:hypothetical protein